jgi:acyl-CoA thioesterase FadM
LNDPVPVEVAKGRVTVVCVRHHADGTMKAADLPSEVSDQLEVAAPELIG